MMTDAHHEMLYTIETRLLKLNEDRLLGVFGDQLSGDWPDWDAPSRRQTTTRGGGVSALQAPSLT